MDDPYKEKLFIVKILPVHGSVSTFGEGGCWRHYFLGEGGYLTIQECIFVLPMLSRLGNFGKVVVVAAEQVGCIRPQQWGTSVATTLSGQISW